jgi:hypothetical protein
MSLLDKSTEDVIIFPEEVVIDIDGNVRTQPSKTGIPARARMQVMGQSGTSSRRQEQDNEGFEGEKVYAMRLPRSFTCVLGAQSEVQWRGARWAVFGDVNIYNNSPRTAHYWYTIKRY